MKTYETEEVQLHAFLTSSLSEDIWSASSRCRFNSADNTVFQFNTRHGRTTWKHHACQQSGPAWTWFALFTVHRVISWLVVLACTRRMDIMILVPPPSGRPYLARNYHTSIQHHSKHILNSWLTDKCRFSTSDFTKANSSHTISNSPFISFQTFNDT
jgi:hypothetical protein